MRDGDHPLFAKNILLEVFNLEIGPYIPIGLDVKFSSVRMSDNVIGLRLEVQAEPGGRSSITLRELSIYPDDGAEAVIEKLRQAARQLASNFDSNHHRSRIMADAIELDNAKEKAAAEAGQAIAELEALL